MLVKLLTATPIFFHVCMTCSITTQCVVNNDIMLYDKLKTSVFNSWDSRSKSRVHPDFLTTSCDWQRVSPLPRERQVYVCYGIPTQSNIYPPIVVIQYISFMTFSSRLEAKTICNDRSTVNSRPICNITHCWLNLLRNCQPWRHIQWLPVADASA